MFRRSLFQIATTLLFTFATVVVPAQADEEAEYQAKLKKVQSQVNAIQKSIAKQQAKRGKEVSELKKSELAIAAIATKMRKVSHQSREAQKELDALNVRAGELGKLLQTHKSSLDLLIKTAYQKGRTPRMQLLLNQQDPALISRMFNYYQHFNLARKREIERALQLLSELAEVRQTQIKAKEKLNKAHAALKAEHVSMQAARKERKTVLAKLETRLSSDTSKLSQLQENQRDLEQLLDQLNKIFTDIPAHPLEQKPFKKLKGKLPWPVRGKLKAKYNSLKGTANLRWKGMFIGAKHGNNVRAIYYGQVAFANWMNGFGLVLIIDHGDGYMSIYANNEALHRTQGEWVVPGDVIATVGDSGGQSKSGVYFEIRRNGRPINPHRWVKKSIKSVSIQ